MREIERLTLAFGRILCPSCAEEARAANLDRAADDGFPIAHIEPTHARLVAAQYRCDACDATGLQAIEPGGPYYKESLA